MMNEILEDVWSRLYGESWKGVIVDEAFAHPAKFSRALIQRIYEHVVAEKWASKGSSVIDPFGGVALGAFPAMQHGLSWIGCELEEKFVALGNQNIDLWNERYSRMPDWGSARLVQGDSRKLAEVLMQTCCVACYDTQHEDQCHNGADVSGVSERGINGRNRDEAWNPGNLSPNAIQGKGVGGEGTVRCPLTGARIGEASTSRGSDPQGCGPLELQRWEGKQGLSKEDSQTAMRNVLNNGEPLHSSQGSRPLQQRTVESSGIVHRLPSKSSQETLLGGEAQGRTDAEVNCSEPLAQICIASPPYAAGCRQTGGEDPKPHYIQSGNKDVLREYGETAGQLGAMKEGDHSLVISSPPYIEGLGHGGAPTRGAGRGDDTNLDAMQNGYGKTEGQLGAMPEGQLCVTSPPFEQGLSLDRPNAAERRAVARERGISNAAHVSPIEMEKLGKRHEGDYGTTEGNLGNMRGGFEAAISSPPYEGNPASTEALYGDKHLTVRTNPRRQNEKLYFTDYSKQDSEGNLGRERGETFWAASRLILEQLHQVIVPGGHAVFVTKRFVRDRKIVEFTDQWIQLCEAVGFRLLHRHKAMLVEDYGTQGGFEKDKRITIARKSFFRRLAEAKNSPAIDWEDVTCFVRL